MRYSHLLMPKRTTIKEIAKAAGVSIGTVDRVLHNRGRVSENTRNVINKLLQKTGYRSHLHASATSMRRSCRILVTIPSSLDGDYWWQIAEGINHAAEEYADLNIDIDFLYFNQYDPSSCRDSFGQISARKPHVVIIGGIFQEETMALCARLGEQGITYYFVDSFIEGVNPQGCYSVDQHACGMLAARILDRIARGDGTFLLFESSRIGNEWAVNSRRRENGFSDYFANCRHKRTIERYTFFPDEPQKNIDNLERIFMRQEPIAGMAIMNSRSHIIAELLKACGRNDIPLVGFDPTSENCRCLKDGSIDVLLCQRPRTQGYLVTVAAIRHILYKEDDRETIHHLPVDILMTDNLPYYEEVFGS